jgi:hypothetical protein
MTINFATNNIKENTQEFYTEIQERIDALVLGKGVKFKIEKGSLAVSYSKHSKMYNILLDGAFIEEVKDAQHAYKALVLLYKAL